MKVTHGKHSVTQYNFLRSKVTSTAIMALQFKTLLLGKRHNSTTFFSTQCYILIDVSH